VPPPRTGAGQPEPLGAAPDGSGVNFAIASSSAEAIFVSLFDAAGSETALVQLPGRLGDVFHGHIAGIGAGARYGLRAHGPYKPQSGHRFNCAKLLVDPYATVTVHLPWVRQVPGGSLAVRLSGHTRRFL
jgi:isoamylase